MEMPADAVEAGARRLHAEKWFEGDHGALKKHRPSLAEDD